MLAGYYYPKLFVGLLTLRTQKYNQPLKKPGIILAHSRYLINGSYSECHCA